MFILAVVLAIADEWRIAEDLPEQEGLFLIASSLLGVDISRIYAPTVVMLAGMMVSLLTYVSMYCHILYDESLLQVTHIRMHVCMQFLHNSKSMGAYAYFPLDHNQF